MQTVLSIIIFIIFVYMLFEIWRSPLGTGAKILWTIFALLFSLITLIVWFVFGKKRAYGRA